MLWRIIRQLERAQSSVYDYLPNSGLQNYLTGMKFIGEDESYDLSLKYEPRKTNEKNNLQP